jgi:hypothetical protein
MSAKELARQMKRTAEIMKKEAKYVQGDERVLCACFAVVI